MNSLDPARSRKILVVDDDPDISLGTCWRLKHAGFETLTASDGDEGVQMAKQHRPDAILLDVRMPRMDGFTALQHLAASPETKDIPVVMLSASIVDQQRALDSEVRFFLPKPCDGKKLLAAIHAVTDCESRGNQPTLT